MNLIEEGDVAVASKTITIGAAVITYNRKDLLLECLRALRKQSIPIDGIIIVDNASTDGTAELLAKAGFVDKMLQADEKPVEVRKTIQIPDAPGDIILIQYIRSDHNIGCSGGQCLAMKAGLDAGYDWLWLMDDDSEPEENALEAFLSSPVSFHPDVVGVACNKVGMDGKTQSIHRGWYFPKYLKAVPLTEAEYSRSVASIGYSSFVGLFVKTRAISVAGLPREDFFLQYDDVEYCIRLGKHGRLCYLRDSVIRHKDGHLESEHYIDRKARTVPIELYWRMYYSFRNQILIYRSHEATISGTITGHITAAYRFLRQMMALIIFDDHKVLRSRVLLKALVDGLLCKSGPNINPSDYQRKALWKRLNS